VPIAPSTFVRLRREILVGGALLVGLVVLLGSSRAAPGQSYDGKGHAVLDGDTIRLLRATGQILQVELYGVDAPERGQPYGDAAARAVRRAVFRVEVRAVVEASGPDGGHLCVVRTAEHVLNEMLLRKGLAWWDRNQAPGNDRYRRLEQRARAAGRGLWAQPHPVPPWRWRGGERP